MTRRNEQRRGARACLTALATAVVLATAGAQAAPGSAGAAHPDTTYARELVLLGQPALLQGAAAGATDPAVAALFRSQAVIAGWTALEAQRGDTVAAGKQYLKDLQAYMDSSPQDLDGMWTLDQAKFILGPLSSPIINRMEYWANSKKDRDDLRPMADLAAQLLKLATTRIQADLAAMGTDAAMRRYANDDAYAKAYMAVMNANGEVDYYRAWSLYFQALAMDEKATGRTDKLKEAATILGQWADGDDTSGVKYQSLLLRGKAYSEARNIPAAVADLTAAEGDKAPEWVQYQARYQVVVAKLRSRDFAATDDEFGKFTTWVAARPGNEASKTAAQISTDMLGYRIEWAKAGELAAGPARDAQRLKALTILSGILEKAPSFRELVFEQLAAQVSGDEDLAKAPPLVQLAVAWTKAQSAGAETDPQKLTDAAKTALQGAKAAAIAVSNNKDARPADKQEALLIAAVCSARLGLLKDAAAYNIQFAEMAPTNPRAKDMVDLARTQLAELMRSGATEEVTALMQRALAWLADRGGETQYLYAAGLLLESQKKYDDAEKRYLRVPPSDPSYLDAQSRLLELAQRRLTELVNNKAPLDRQQDQAKTLNDLCTRYLGLLTKLPEAEQKARAKNMIDLRLVQVRMALTLHTEEAGARAAASKHALEGLDALDAAATKYGVALTPDMQGTLLRYRIMALQMAGQSKEVMALIDKLPAADRPGIIKGFVYSSLQEITEAEAAKDMVRSKEIAGTVADLLGLLVQEDKTGDTYLYQQLQADMLARAGKATEAIKMWQALQTQKPTDVLNFMGEARAMFINAQQTNSQDEYRKSLDYFERLLKKLESGKESYWEAWLRIIQCWEAGGRSADEIKKRLHDLKEGYGDAIGGTRYKEEFKSLLVKYAVP